MLNTRFSNRLASKCLLITSLFSAAFLSACHSPDSIASEEQPYTAEKQQVPDLPASFFLKPVDRTSVKLSPDGQHVAYIARGERGPELWVRSVSASDDLKLAGGGDSGEMVPGYLWMPDSQRIAAVVRSYQQRREFIRVFDLDGNQTDVSPDGQTRFGLIATSADYPEEILIATNIHSKKSWDAARLNLQTKEMTLVSKRPQNLIHYIPGRGLNLKAVVCREIGIHGEGKSVKVPYHLAEGNEWQPVVYWVIEDDIESRLLWISEDDSEMVTIDSRGRDTSAVVYTNLELGVPEIIASDPQADVDDVVIDDLTGTVQAVSFDRGISRWQVLDDAIRSDFNFLTSKLGPNFKLVERTPDDRIWLVGDRLDSGILKYMVYNRDDHSLQPLFWDHRALQGLPLATMHPLEIPNRNGTPMVSYFTLPAGMDELKPGNPLPVVMLVRSNAWQRDKIRYNSLAQWLCNHGYVVVSVNNHGASGFGKKYRQDGYLQWGGLMKDDLVDAGRWLIDKGYAEPDKFAIIGADYGGFAAMTICSDYPDVFAAGVNIFGPLDLVSMIESVGGITDPKRKALQKRIGNARNDRYMLHDISPVTRVTALKKPCLFIRRAGNPQISRKDLAALQTIVNFNFSPFVHVIVSPKPGGGHDPNEVDYVHNIIANFLATSLGLPTQPLGQDLLDSSIYVVRGSEYLTWQDGVTPPPVDEKAEASPGGRPPAAPPATEETPTQQGPPVKLPPS